MLALKHLEEDLINFKIFLYCNFLPLMLKNAPAYLHVSEIWPQHFICKPLSLHMTASSWHVKHSEEINAAWLPALKYLEGDFTNFNKILCYNFLQLKHENTSAYSPNQLYMRPLECSLALISNLQIKLLISYFLLSVFTPYHGKGMEFFLSALINRNLSVTPYFLFHYLIICCW